MVREEYLNPEFMYKFINSLCKADGWIMYFFAFGKLTYQNFKQPTLMQNNHGYNMVYKFQVYKLRDDSFNYGKNITWKGKEVIYVNSSNLAENIICKDIYFDILNECFVEHDDTVLNFEEFPSFFKLNNQLYYGVYNQPKVLKYHYSKARNCYNLENYMHTMDINLHNLFDPHNLLCNMIDKANRIYKQNSHERWEFLFNTQKEANLTIKKVLTQDYKSCECEKFYKIEENFYSKLSNKDGYIKLHIHKPEFPIFYTDNVLELTIPITEAVEELSHKVSKALYSIQETITLLANSIGQLMSERLADYYSSAFHAKMKDILYNFSGYTFIELIQECHKVAMNWTRDKREEYNNISENLARQSSRATKDISQINDCCEALCSNIKKIKTSEFSLNTLLEISNGFKLLEACTKE